MVNSNRMGTTVPIAQCGAMHGGYALHERPGAAGGALHDSYRHALRARHTAPIACHAVNT